LSVVALPQTSLTAARPGLATALVALALGAVLGAGAATLPQTVALADALILASLGIAVFLLTRIAERTDGMGAAGDASYRAYFENAVEGIFRTTPSGRYLDANPALARIYGYGSVATLKTALVDIEGQLYVDPGRRAAFEAQMAAHDRVTAFESQIRRRDGTTIWISENARAIRDWSGRLICYEGTVEDISGRHAAQDALRKALAEAEEASRAKSAFLAAMSHELKTPLNAVLGFSEIIKSEMLGPITPARYREYADDIYASGTRLLAIVSDVLDVARLSGGAITLNSRPSFAASLADEALSLARLTTGDTRTVAIHAPEPLPLVDVDPQRLRQALTNVICNALKFTPPLGKIHVDVGLEIDGGVSFAVSDTGIGMAPEKIAAALEPFRQLDGSLARRFEGAGLGLSISKSLVELHGGQLSIESAPGRGTTVTISLPPVRTRQHRRLAG
jgi:PAS domain S-box-containing protein